MEIEAIEYKGCDIKIFQDENPMDPRENDNLGVMVCFHKRYSLGDKTDYDSGNYSSWSALETDIINRENPLVILPLYLYDHSGLRMKVGDFHDCALPQGHAEFDSGQVGFIFARKAEAREEFGVKRISKKLRAKVEDILREEMKIYDYYISGQVYGYNTVDKTGENIDSLWGFYGSLEESGLLDEARASIDSYIVRRREKKSEKLKALIRNNVSLDKREKVLA